MGHDHPDTLATAHNLGLTSTQQVTTSKQTTCSGTPRRGTSGSLALTSPAMRVRQPS